jgi:hypothetical protein
MPKKWKPGTLKHYYELSKGNRTRKRNMAIKPRTTHHMDRTTGSASQGSHHHGPGFVNSEQVPEQQQPNIPESDEDCRRVSNTLTTVHTNNYNLITTQKGVYNINRVCWICMFAVAYVESHSLEALMHLPRDGRWGRGVTLLWEGGIGEGEGYSNSH